MGLLTDEVITSSIQVICRSTETVRNIIAHLNGFEIKMVLKGNAMYCCFNSLLLSRCLRLRLAPLALFLCGLLAPCYLLADSLEMPSDIGATPGENKDVDKPVRGMTMDDVSNKYGEPSKILPAVGNPPITRWVYPEFIVTFERNYVIFAVVPRKPPQP